MKNYITYNEKLPLSIHIIHDCNCGCVCKCDDGLEDLQKQIDDLRDYIKRLHHGIHFISGGEEPPIICSRLDFM
jgi:hypothetical protein